MSEEKSKRDALRWFRTAQSDFEAASLLLREGKHSHACFLFQQSAEKAMKAIFRLYGVDPWGHSVRKLIDHLKDIGEELYEDFKPLIEEAIYLDRFYIPARYPDGLPGLIPDEAFTARDSQEAMSITLKVLNKVKQRLEV